MATYNYNGTAASLFEVFGNQTMATALLYVNSTEFGFTNADGSTTYVSGTGFVWDATAGKFTAGLATAIFHYSNGSYVDEVNTVSVAAGDLQEALQTGTASLKALLLAGDDYLRGVTATTSITMTGEAGNDGIYGGKSDDFLFGGDGNDRIVAGKGNDQLFGEAGLDVLFGGQGHDVLVGGDGDDRLIASSGDDQLFGGNDNDILFAGVGNDSLEGDAGDDTLYGGGGNDSLLGEAGNDRLVGGAGIDLLSGGTGDDRLFGSTGNDDIFGGDGDDFEAGGGGNDQLIGDAGQDRLFGGEGDDVLEGGIDDDYINGGDGFDTAVFAGNANDYVVTVLNGVNRLIIDGPDGVDKVINVENFQFDDGAYTWDASNNVWQSIGECLDNIPAGTPIDIELIGTAGNDNLSITTDDNAAVCGAGGNDTILTRNGNDWAFGGAGDDFIQTDFDTLNIKGNSNDHLFGEAGNDTLLGRGGNDVLNGDSGDDVLKGGDNDDDLTGGTGADLFVFRYDQDKFVKEEWGNDVVQDFELGIDHLQFEWGFNVFPPLQPSDLVLTMTAIDADTVVITGVPGNIGSVTVYGAGVGGAVLDDLLI